MLYNNIFLAFNSIDILFSRIWEGFNYNMDTSIKIYTAMVSNMSGLLFFFILLDPLAAFTWFIISAVFWKYLNLQLSPTSSQNSSFIYPVLYQILPFENLNRHPQFKSAYPKLNSCFSCNQFPSTANPISADNFQSLSKLGPLTTFLSLSTFSLSHLHIIF